MVCHTPAVLAGLALLDAGGDFADGVIAFEGELLGGAEFVSFDRQAVGLLRWQKRKARLLCRCRAACLKPWPSWSRLGINTPECLRGCNPGSARASQCRAYRPA